MIQNAYFHVARSAVLFCGEPQNAPRLIEIKRGGKY